MHDNKERGIKQEKDDDIRSQEGAKLTCPEVVDESTASEGKEAAQPRRPRQPLAVTVSDGVVEEQERNRARGVVAVRFGEDPLLGHVTASPRAGAAVAAEEQEEVHVPELRELLHAQLLELGAHLL